MLWKQTGLRLLLLGLTLLGLAGSVWWDNALNRGISAVEAPPAWAAVPRGGINVYNLHAEVSHDPQGSVIPDNKVAKTFAMIRAAGFKWVRIQFPWEDIELERKGNFLDTRHNNASTWIKYDYIVAQAAANDLQLIVRLDRPPAWARAGWIATPEVQAQLQLGREVTGPPDRLEDFGDFAAAVAARYPQVRFFQIWNEPNLQFEWNFHRQDPAALVALLRVAATRIRAVRPEAVIISPSLAPTDGLDGTGVNDLEYLDGMYGAGGRDTFDILGAQLYGLGQPPTEHRYVRPGKHPLRPIETRADVSRIVLLREIMERHGDSAKAIWISELGWNSAPKTLGPTALTWGEPVSEEVKGQYLVQAMERADQEWPWMGVMCVWMFRFGPTPANPADPTPYFQLVNFDFEPLPALDTLQRYFAQPPAPVAPRSLSRFLPPLAMLIAVVGTVALTVWLAPVLGALLGLAVAGVIQRGQRLRQRTSSGVFGRVQLGQRDGLIFGLLLVALVWFYRASAQLPLTAAGGATLLLLATWRPDLALLLVPLVLPLYLAPKGIWDERFGIRPSGLFLPLQEIVLLCVVAGIGLRGLVALRQPRRTWAWLRDRLGRLDLAWPEFAPLALLALAGTLGVIVADPAGRAEALRSWRWLIVEPLVFYALARWFGQRSAWRQRLLAVWLGTGVIVALIGVLQVAGLNLRPVIADRPCFSEALVQTEGVRRATSLYCHPNNLGLALGRVWPIWLALGFAAGGTAWRGLDRWRFLQRLGVARPDYLALGGLVLVGVVASFSKGALLGAGLAVALVGWLLRKRWLLALTGVAAVIVLGGGLVVGIERLNPLGGSSGARAELWQSGVLMLRDHPVLGVGLDQYLRLRNPELANGYIAPAAALTNERFASHPHNLVLDTLLQIGWLGLLALGWAAAGAIRRGWHHVHARPGYVVGLIAALFAATVHGLVDNFYFVPDLAFSFWLIVLLLGTTASPEPIVQPAQRKRPISRSMIMEEIERSANAVPPAEDDAAEPLPARVATPNPEPPETIGKLVFVSTGEYPYPFKVAKPPRFWMEEQTGVLAAAVEAYLNGEKLKPDQLAAIKVYLKQYVERALLAGEAKVGVLVTKIEKLKSTSDLERFADEVADLGAEVF